MLPLPFLAEPSCAGAGANVTTGGAASDMRGGGRSVVLNVEGWVSVGDGGKEDGLRACLG